MSRGSGWRPSEAQLRNLRQQKISTVNIKKLVIGFRALLDQHPSLNTQEFINFALSIGTNPLSLEEEDVEKESEAGCIPSDWLPSDQTVSSLIALGMTKYRILEEAVAFRSYWLARNEHRPNWNASFISRITYLQRETAERDNRNKANRSSRNISLADQLTDTSWAEHLVNKKADIP